MRLTMKMDLWYESFIDLTQPQHNAALRSLINALMKSVGEHGEFRIELGGALHYGTYTVTKPGETVEVRVTPLKKRLRKSLNTAKPQVIRDNIVIVAGKAPREPGAPQAPQVP
jgi:hypothetical protein